MATCGGCGTTTTRVRTTYLEDERGRVVDTREECPRCRPGSFEPRWLQERGAAAWEAYPTKYKKRYMPDGRVGYFATDEWRADTEAKIADESRTEGEARRKALDEKRRERRTNPMSQWEIEQALKRWRPRLAR